MNFYSYFVRVKFSFNFFKDFTVNSKSTRVMYQTNEKLAHYRYHDLLFELR